MGTLMKNTQRQPADWVSAPPATSPADPPAVATKLYTLIARARPAGSGNNVTTIPRHTADSIAPPMPWANRPPVSIA